MVTLRFPAGPPPRPPAAPQLADPDNPRSPRRYPAMFDRLLPGLDRGAPSLSSPEYTMPDTHEYDLVPESTHRPRSIARNDVAPIPEGTSLYLGGPASQRPLTREQEVALARRVNEGELAMLRALVQSPAAIRELAAVGQDLAEGRLQVRDLLRTADEEDAGNEDAQRRLTALFKRARSLAAATSKPRARARTPATRARPVAASSRGRAATAATGLAPEALRLLRALETTRLHRRVLDRVAAAAREAPATTRSAQRVVQAIEASRRTADRAKAELVRRNLGLVFMFAKRNVRHGLPLHDLVQEGNIGLMRAVDKFDPERGIRFSTYAAWWVRQQMTRAVLDQARTIRVPVHLADARQKLRRAQRVFEASHGRAPTEAELREHSGLFPEKVRAVLGLTPEPLSLDAPTSADSEGRIGDLLVDRASRAPDEQIATDRMRAQARRLLDRLTPREQDILRRRFGLDNAPEQTLQEIGESLSISRERVRQIEAEALRKLRAPSMTQELDSYLAA